MFTVLYVSPLQGYSRKGSALFKLNRLTEAEKTYQEGLKVDPNNASLKEGLDEVANRQGEWLEDRAAVQGKAAIVCAC